MAVQVGVGYIDIRPDLSGFSRDLKSGMSRDLSAAGVEGGKVAGSSLADGFKKAMAIGGVTLGAVAVKDFLKSAVGATSDLNEQVSKTNAVFKDSAGTIEAWAASGADNFGLSQRAALEAASGFGNMFSQLGIGLDQSAAMSTRLVELAADFASFHNADISQVLEAQAAGFRGEYDSLQRFLPLINAATVAQRAMELTGKKNVAALTAQDKALATNALILEGAGDAAGDFDRTSDSLANRMRKLSAESENAKAKLGEALAPTISALAGVLTDYGIPAFLKFGEVIGEGLADAAGFAIGALADFVSVTAKVLEKIDQFVPGLEGVPEAMRDAVDEMRSWEASAHDLHSVFGDVTQATDAQTAATGELVTNLKDLTTLTTEAADAQRDLDKATRTLGAANREKADAQKDLNALIAKGAVDEEKVADARERLADASRSAAGADRDLAKAQRAYDAALANANDLRGLDTAQEALADAADDLADAQDRAQAAHEDAAAAEKDLRDAQAGDPDFQDKLADARDRVADATDGIAEAEKKLAAASAAAVGAHDAERVALQLKADQVERLRIQTEQLLALGLADFIGPISPQQILAAQGASPDFIGPKSPQQGAKVTVPTDFIGPLGPSQTYAQPKVNNVTVNVTQSDPQPQELARKIVWALD